MPRGTSPDPFLEFDRAHWARLRADTPLTLSEEDVERLRGIVEEIDLDEVAEIYLPLSRLLDLYVGGTRDVYAATERFLGHPDSRRVPYVIGIAGSVAAGKSTTARILVELLSHWPGTPRVDLVTTDGFLYPNAELDRRGLMRRKGFPESYDVKALLEFMGRVKAGQRATSPVYSHLTYDIVPGDEIVVDGPDIVLVEGLNVLQTGTDRGDGTTVFVSDYFDFAIYVDAEEDNLESWYVERFLKLRDTAFARPESYFHRYASLDDGQARDFALQIWHSINLPNLRENILPTRGRARLILRKGADHRVERVWLRRI